MKCWESKLWLVFSVLFLETTTDLLPCFYIAIFTKTTPSFLNFHQWKCLSRIFFWYSCSWQCHFNSKTSYMFLLSASPRCLTTTRDARVRLSNERLPVGIVTCCVCWIFFLVPRGDVGTLGNTTLVLVINMWLQHVIKCTTTHDKHVTTTGAKKYFNREHATTTRDEIHYST